MTIKQAVIFSILMQNGGGILGKSPDYIKEKLVACEWFPDEVVDGLLDRSNLMKLAAWKERWEMEK